MHTSFVAQTLRQMSVGGKHCFRNLSQVTNFQIRGFILLSFVSLEEGLPSICLYSQALTQEHKKTDHCHFLQCSWVCIELQYEKADIQKCTCNLPTPLVGQILNFIYSTHHLYLYYWQVSENMLTTEKQKEINSYWFLKHELKKNASHALGLNIVSVEVWAFSMSNCSHSHQIPTE